MEKDRSPEGGLRPQNQCNSPTPDSDYLPCGSAQRRSPQYLKKSALDYKVMIVDVSTQGSSVQIESGDFDQYIGEYEHKVMRKGVLLSAREARSVLFYENRYLSRGVQADAADDSASRFLASAYLRVRAQQDLQMESSQKPQVSQASVASSQSAKVGSDKQGAYVSDAFQRVIDKYKTD